MKNGITCWDLLPIDQQLEMAWGRQATPHEVNSVMGKGRGLPELGEFAVSYAAELPEVVIKPQPAKVPMLARFISSES